MRKRNGFEWEDQPWFPSFLREYMTDFLRFVLHTGNLYNAITPLLVEAVHQSKSKKIIDLCSGAGGAVKSVQQNIFQVSGSTIPFVLSDLFPNMPAYKQLEKETNGTITYYSSPVDATKVPRELQGFRTIFSGFHHFDETAARQVLQDAVDANEGIAVFDGGSRNIGFILLILVFHPLGFLFLTPFIKPFSLRRLLFTYLIPIVPFCTIWDGVMSVLRLYTPCELQQLTSNLTKTNLYTWQSGVVTNNLGIRIAYLIGFPNSKN